MGDLSSTHGSPFGEAKALNTVCMFLMFIIRIIIDTDTKKLLVVVELNSPVLKRDLWALVAHFCFWLLQM